MISLAEEEWTRYLRTNLDFKQSEVPFEVVRAISTDARLRSMIDTGTCTIKNPSLGANAALQLVEEHEGNGLNPLLDMIILSVGDSDALLASFCKEGQGLDVLTEIVSANRFSLPILTRALFLMKQIMSRTRLAGSVELVDFLKTIITWHGFNSPIGEMSQTILILHNELASRPVLPREDLIRGYLSGKVCHRCDSVTHSHCSALDVTCPNCRGNAALCPGGACMTTPCRVCASMHPDTSMVECLRDTSKPTCQQAEEHTVGNEAVVLGQKRFRSVREYKAQKRIIKSGPGSAVQHPIKSPKDVFTKLLKDTVAKHCYERLGNRPMDIADDSEDIPLWRSVSRIISSTLLDKESRLPDGVRFDISDPLRESAAVKRVSDYTLSYLDRKYHL
jgi:hypothetical protein